MSIGLDAVMPYDEALSKFDPVLGLEVHVELNTATKMFCGCAVAFGGEPNTRTCPVCLGLPGSLPVVNAKAIESAIRIGLALNCDIAEGHISAALCHLANISYRLGTESTFDKDITAFAGCKEAAEALGRMKAHLTANKVDLAKVVGRVGPKLAFDAKTETFTGSGASQANPMLTREYRKGFEVPQAV